MRKLPRRRRRPVELPVLQQRWAEAELALVFSDCIPLALTGSPTWAPGALPFQGGAKSYITVLKDYLLGYEFIHEVEYIA